MSFRSESLCKLEVICLSLLLFLLFCSELAAQDIGSKAKTEKKLVLYHTTTVADTQKIIDSFRKKYPFIEVDTYRATNEKLTQKILSEVKAGRNLADVYINGIQTLMLKDMGLLSRYSSPEREHVANAFKDTQG